MPTKRLRGVLDSQPSNQEIDGDPGVEGGSQNPTQGEGAGPRSRSSSGGTGGTGCKLTQEEIDAIEAKVDEYKLEAQKAERGLPENVTVTGHELEAATRAAVRFVLMNNSNSEGALLSGRDLNAQIASFIVQKKGVPAVVVARTQYVLAKSFGMELVEMEKVGVKSGGKYYVLRSLCPGSIYMETVGTAESIEVLEKRYLRTADPDRGRFRSFLLTTFKRFMSTEAHRIQAAKRGGGKRVLSLDFPDGEQRYALEPADPWTADKLYD